MSLNSDIRTALFAVGLAALIFIFINAIARWRIFTKAGEKGWKALIPFYSIYISCRLFWKKHYFWIFLALSSLNAVLYEGFAGKSVIAARCTAVLALAELIFHFILALNTARHFECQDTLAVALLCFPATLNVMLGFGKREYREEVRIVTIERLDEKFA